MGPGTTRPAMAILLGFAVLTAGCGTVPDDGPTVVVPGRPGEPAQVLSGSEAAQRRTPVPVSPADVEFVEAMIPHHRQALDMAGLAADRAADPQVRGLAARIDAVQGPEIAVMEAWLARQELYTGDHHGGDMDGMDVLHPGMLTPAQLDELAAADGPAFDRLFVALMTAHHEGAITMARAVGVAGTDITVGEIAQDVVVTQTAEIDRMRGLPPT